ncbi:RHE_PE00001 family protein [Bradyrhizobium jicamae]|uniref:RHE_PE00001 family protein n=1 Tax=Bradyrhizobium jicamae TaxID=280332 RepID=UPI001BA718CB|nr:RHE_PE00001 family protein [Bradyrhizobium jicamae]MBR0939230.1 DUF1612 and helix-turn-helix domain-containing protein [Bradyrhizobium jicamae]
MTEQKSVLASVTSMLVRVIKALSCSYRIPDPLPWAQLAGPLAAAEDAVARHDERLGKSPIRDGAISRTHFADACASLWLDGELVHLEDLVLHDAGMDVRAPTHELTRAHAVLRARRRIAESKPDWALSAAGLASLQGRNHNAELDDEETCLEDGERDSMADDVGGEQGSPDVAAPTGILKSDSDLDMAFAAIDAANAKAERRLASELRSQPERDALIYDPDWDEEGRLEHWRGLVVQTRSMPPTLAAAIAADAWGVIEPLEHMPWLGRLLAASVLRDRGKTRAHLLCLHTGLKSIPRERRRPRDPAARLLVLLEAMTAAAEADRKDHDRWLMTRNLLARKLAGRRATSKLPALIDYVLAKPIVSAGMIAAELGITPRAAQNLVADLGLREATGRGRYRAWGIL